MSKASMQNDIDIKIFRGIEPYTTGFILSLLNTLDVIFKGQVSMESLLDFYRVFGEMTSKISLFGSQSHSSIRHLRGLLNYCLHMMEVGYDILLIEGCSMGGARIISDVDGLMTKEGKLTAFDYKYIGAVHFTVINDEKKQSILNTLRFEHESIVVTGPSDQLEFHLSLNLPEVNCEFDKEFGMVDNLIEWMQNKTLEDIKDPIKNLSTKIHDLPDSKPVVKLSKSEVSKHLESLKYVVSENSVNSSKEFSRLRRALRKLQSKELCGDYYDIMQSYETKYLTPIPLIHGTCSMSDSPKVRAEKIIENSKASTVFLKYLSGDEMDVSVDHSFSDCLDYDFYRGRRLRRLKRNGKYVNGFSIDMDTSEMYSVNHGNREILDHERLEEMLESSRSLFDSVTNSTSVCDDVVDTLIDKVMPDVEESVNAEGKPNLKKYIIEQLRRTMSEISTKQISQLMSIHQEVSQSVLMSSKVSNLRRGHSVFFSNISNRMAISFNTMTFSTSELNDTACCVHGQLSSDNGFIVKQLRTCLSTDWFNMSPPMLNWLSCVYLKYLSYSSQYLETSLANSAKPISTFEIGMLMLINRSGFSQASESIRYLFVNSTGIKKKSCEDFSKTLSFQMKDFMNHSHM
jgi:hypothetical protein